MVVSKVERFNTHWLVPGQAAPEAREAHVKEWFMVATGLALLDSIRLVQNFPLYHSFTEFMAILALGNRKKFNSNLVHAQIINLCEFIKFYICGTKTGTRIHSITLPSHHTHPFHPSHHIHPSPHPPLRRTYHQATS